MKIAFLWEGVSYRWPDRTHDGLWAAIQILQERHQILCLEPDDERAIMAFAPDAILYWAPFTARTKNLVTQYPFKKAICFAGGPIEPGNVDGFDLYFTESEINEIELALLGKPFMRAFGVNEQLYKPMEVPKRYTAAFAGSFALWKRPELFAKAVGKGGIWIGQKQPHETIAYEVCEQHGVETRDELLSEEVPPILNAANCVLNTAGEWGGGQRLTLEAMACNVPVIVMHDAPKNKEFVEESGCGLVCYASVEAIKDMLPRAMALRQDSRAYVLSKWTAKHYADKLEYGLTQL